MHRPRNCVYYIYLNDALIKKSEKGGSLVPFDLVLDSVRLTNSANNLLRFVVKDHSMPAGNDWEEVGCVSVPFDYFKNLPAAQHG